MEWMECREVAYEDIKTTKQEGLWNSPPVLILNLKRFSNASQRLSADVDVPINLDMSSYKAEYAPEDAIKKQYKLCAFINHLGGFSSKEGHYIAFVKNNNSWWKYSDGRVKKVRANAIQEEAKKAYILFYERDERE